MVKVALVCFAFLMMVSLSFETCEYKKDVFVHIIGEEWWTGGGEHSKLYNYVILCTASNINQLQSTSYRLVRPCDRRSYYYCESQSEDYYALSVNNSNVTVLTQFALENLSPLTGLKITNSNINIIEKDTFWNLRSLVELDLSNNNLSSLPDRLFASNIDLKILDLSNNVISSVENTTFSLGSIKYLNLRNNSLTKLDFKLPQSLINLDLSFNRISFILKDSFSTLKQLTELKFSHNALHTLSTGLLTANTKLEIADLSYNNISSIGKVVFFLHSLKNLNMQNNNLELIDFTLPFSLTYLDLRSNRIRNIKNDVFLGLNNLNTLKLNNNLLETVLSDLFKPLENLNEIDLQHNNLSFLANELFALNGNLKLVNFAENNISAVDQSAFVSQSIVYLNLTCNKIHCVNFTLPKSLLFLDLSSNSIGQISKFSFLNTTNLQEIHLNKNTLKDLPSKLFETLNNVTYINLQDNKITVLPDKLFGSNTSFSNLTLNLSNNSISSLNEETLPAHGITYLHMQHNELRKISYKLPTSLVHLNLSSNLISTMENDPFNGITSLKSLWLSDNLLQEIPPGYFKTLNNLQSLYLFNNRIEIAFGTLTGLKRLHELSLANNSISNLQEQMLFDLKQLFWLDISDNFLTKFDITDIKKYMYLLNKIYLDGNKFECPYIWELIKRLKDNGIIVPEGNHFYRSNVQGIECIETQKNSDKSDNFVSPENAGKNVFNSETKEISKILKEMLSDTIVNNKLSKSVTEEKLQLTLDKINSNLASANLLSNSSNKRLESALKDLSSNLNTTNRFLSASEERIKHTLKELGTHFSSENKSSDTKLLLQTLKQISTNMQNITIKTNTSSDNFAEQFQRFLDLFSSNLNATTNAINSSYIKFATELEKLENLLLKLNETHELSTVGVKEFLKMESTKSSVDTLPKNFSSTKQAEQINVYYPLQTVILLALLGVTIFMFYFLYMQLKIIKMRRTNNECLTEMDNIIME